MCRRTVIILLIPTCNVGNKSVADGPDKMIDFIKITCGNNDLFFLTCVTITFYIVNLLAFTILIKSCPGCNVVNTS